MPCRLCFFSCYPFAADVIHLGFYQKKFWTAQFRKHYAGIALPSCGFLQHCDTFVTCMRSLSLLLKHPVDLIFHGKVALTSHLILPLFSRDVGKCVVTIKSEGMLQAFLVEKHNSSVQAMVTRSHWKLRMGREKFSSLDNCSRETNQ